MNDSKEFTNFDVLFDQLGSGNAPWRFFVSLGILVVGLIVLEILFRFIKKNLQKYMNKKGLSPEDWNIPSILSPLRLIFIALLLWMAESAVIIPVGLVYLLHGIEALLVALSVILISFQLIRMLNRLPSALPQKIQEGFPEPTVSRLKSILRVSVLIMVGAAFVYTQRNLFPEWLWKYAWWRYLLIIVIINLVFLLTRLSEKFLSGMLIDLKDQEEKICRLVELSL